MLKLDIVACEVVAIPVNVSISLVASNDPTTLPVIVKDSTEEGSVNNHYFKPHVKDTRNLE